MPSVAHVFVMSDTINKFFVEKKLEEDDESIKLLNGTAETELRSAIGDMKEALKQSEGTLQEKNQMVRK